MFEIKIEVTEIDNGWIVSEFSRNGPSNQDRTLFFTTYDEIITELKDYYKEIMK